MPVQKSASPNQVPILGYHFTGTPADDEDAPYTISAEAFDQQMRYLANEGYRSISLSNLQLSLSESGRCPERSVVITFDDGRACVYGGAFPILKKYHLTATVFLISSHVDHANFLNPSQILEMKEYGISFESHGVTHARFSSLTEREMLEEAGQSRMRLEELLGQPVRFFAYPYGSYNSVAQEALRLSGYAGAVCSKVGYASEISDPFALPRVGIRRSDSLATYVRKLSGNAVETFNNKGGGLRRRLASIPSRIAGAWHRRRLGVSDR